MFSMKWLIAPLVRRVADALVKRFPGTFASALRRRAASLTYPEARMQIRRGLFESVTMEVGTWNFSDRASIEAGFYEMEVQRWIKKHIPTNPRDIFVFGGGDGLYALGLYQNGFGSRCICFEESKASQRVIKRNWIQNKLPLEALSLIGEFRGLSFHPEIQSFDKRGSFFVVDIEGSEAELIDDEFLEHFSGASGVIEIHRVEDDYISNLADRYQKYFQLEIIRVGPRDIGYAPELLPLPDDLKWSIMSEGRSFPGVWFGVTPKESNPT